MAHGRRSHAAVLLPFHSACNMFFLSVIVILKGVSSICVFVPTLFQLYRHGDLFN